jgi:hypothetical protein
MTEKGKKSEFLLVIGEKAETTHCLYIVPTPLEYWLLTTFPRERWYRHWWLATQPATDQVELFKRLAQNFPTGLSEVPELPEERCGEVGLMRSTTSVPSRTPHTPKAEESEAEESLLIEEVV